MGDRVRDVFDEQADFWTAHYAPNGPMLNRIERFQQATSSHRAQSVAVILDLGCGTGELAAALLEGGSVVVGADVSRQMLGVAHKRAPTACLLQLSSASAEWPFRAESFDVITASSVFEYVPDPEALLRNLRNALRPEGILAFTVPNLASAARQREARLIPWVRAPLLKRLLKTTRWRAYAQYLQISVNRHSESDWRRLIEKAGLSLVAIQGGADPLSMLVASRTADRA